MQPCFATYCTGEIQFVKNGEFFLSMKNGYIAKRSFVYLHNEKTINFKNYSSEKTLKAMKIGE